MSDSAGDLVICEPGHIFWGHVDFSVPYGTGGAIFTTGNGAEIDIINSTFLDNVAGQATTIQAVAANRVTIKDSHQESTHDGSMVAGSPVDPVRVH